MALRAIDSEIVTATPAAPPNPPAMVAVPTLEIMLAESAAATETLPAATSAPPSI